MRRYILINLLTHYSNSLASDSPRIQIEAWIVQIKYMWWIILQTKLLDCDSKSYTKNTISKSLTPFFWQILFCFTEQTKQLIAKFSDIKNVPLVNSNIF